MGLTRWWQHLRAGARPVDESRWVVLDVETSGLDPSAARLLAIAAIAVRIDWPGARLAIDIGDSFEVVLGQQEVSSRDNILLHGIGEQRQRDGVPPAQALRAFAAYAGASPLLAFHSAFDETMIGRYARQHLGSALANPWVDIEQLCAVTHPKSRARALDDWMGLFGVSCAQRHQAAADTLAECEVLARVWPKLARECRCWRDVQRLAASHRWIARA